MRRGSRGNKGRAKVLVAGSFYYSEPPAAHKLILRPMSPEREAAAMKQRGKSGGSGTGNQDQG